MGVEWRPPVKRSHPRPTEEHPLHPPGGQCDLCVAEADQRRRDGLRKASFRATMKAFRPTDAELARRKR